MVGFLLQKLETGNERSKAATLGVMRHIIYSTGKLLQTEIAKWNVTLRHVTLRHFWLHYVMICHVLSGSLKG